MFIAVDLAEGVESDFLFDIEILVKLDDDSFPASQPSHEKTGGRVGHLTVTLHEAEERNSLSFDVDILKMFTQNYGSRCQEPPTPGHHMSLHLGQIWVDLPSSCHSLDLKDHELLSQETSHRPLENDTHCFKLPVDCPQQIHLYESSNQHIKISRIIWQIIKENLEYSWF